MKVASENAAARNVRLYLPYRVATSCFAWLPVFFLFFAQHVSFDEVLTLEAIYYLSVVVAEVPTGYVSDRLGRVAVLRVSAVAFVASYTIFVMAADFAAFAGAQALLGFAMACQSGSDTALHYASLAALSRSDEYGWREARAERAALAMLAVAALAGGVTALHDPRLAYAVSLASAVAALVLSWRLAETPSEAASASTPTPTLSSTGLGLRGFGEQLGRVRRSLADAELRWLFAFMIVLYVLAHVPYEFYQPWLDALLEGAQTPLSSAALYATGCVVAAYVAGRSMRARQRLGRKGHAALCLGLAIFVIAALGLTIHPALLVVIAGRGVPMALAQAPLRAAIAARVETGMLATFSSVQALVGRLGFGLFLLAVAHTTQRDAGDDATAKVLTILRMSSLGALVVGLVLLFTYPRDKQPLQADDAARRLPP